MSSKEDTDKKGKKSLRNGGRTNVGAFNETESQEPTGSQRLSLTGLSIAQKAVGYRGLAKHGKTDQSNQTASTSGECDRVSPSHSSVYHGLRRTSVNDKEGVSRPTPNLNGATSYPPIKRGLHKRPASKRATDRPTIVEQTDNLEAPACPPISTRPISRRAPDPPATVQPTDNLYTAMEQPDDSEDAAERQYQEMQEPQVVELDAESGSWHYEEATTSTSRGQEQESSLEPPQTDAPPQTMSDNSTATIDVEANLSVANDESLVEARPVEEEDSLVEAAPFDVTADEQQRAEKRHKRQLQQMTAGLGMVLLVVLIILGVVIGVVLYGSSNPETIILPPTPMQNQTDPPNATPPPTTMAPTNPLEEFRATLPGFTQASLRETTSPQSLAYNWLFEHPEVSNMTESRKLQLFVLGTLYHSLGGPYWRNNLNKDWMDYKKHECDWYSSLIGAFDDLFFCREFLSSLTACEFYTYESVCVNGQVGVIVLASIQPDTPMNDTQIEIPPEIGLLSTTLKGLWLVNMNVTGTIPTEIGLLDSLETLQLNRNSITGTIPKELQNTKVESIELSDNQLSGSIPSELALFSDLEQLALISNALTGPLPSGLEMLPNLTTIAVSGNRITGQVPSVFSESLTWLVISNNRMDGSLPSEIGLATKLETLHLSSNAFTGSLPTELTLLSKLEALGVFNNNFQGSLPNNLGAMTSLTWLSTGENDFTGSVPTSIGLLKNLSEALLSDSDLTGTIPSEIGLLQNLEEFFLDGNSLSGTLPTEIGLLESCKHIGLYGKVSGRSNAISGPIPSELGLLSRLVLFDVESNQLTGTVPDSLERLGNLTRLYLNDNSLFGSLPNLAAYEGKLEVVWLGNNGFSGSLDNLFTALDAGRLTDMISFKINDLPLLNGTIPHQLQGLVANHSLRILDLSGSVALSGTIPADMCILNNDSCFLQGYNDLSCSLKFDCTDILCGCDCACDARK